MRISIIGLPGSGKTTLASLIGSMFKTMHISSGELARAHGFAGSKAELTGQLDPDEGKIRELVTKAIGDSNAYILDGFPRTVDQIEDIELPLDAVLWLRLNHPKTGINRLLKRNRPDDKLDIIEARVKTYFKYTYPLMEYYEIIGTLIPIDATGTIVDTLAYSIIQLAKKDVLEARKHIRKLLKHDFKGKETRKAEGGNRESTKRK